MVEVEPIDRQTGDPYYHDRIKLMRLGQPFIYEMDIAVPTNVNKYTIVSDFYFPSCNQYVHLPENNRLFVTGGSQVEHQNKCYEVVLSNTESSYRVVTRANMYF